MFKTVKLIMIGSATALVFTTGIHAYTGHIKKFVGENGKEITVQCGNKVISDFGDLGSKKKFVIDESRNPALGDILIVDGFKERVIALGEGGEYITELLK